MSEVISSNAVAFPGEVNISKADLITHAGVRIDITGIIQQFNIFEDLYSNYLTCTIIISDAVGLFSMSPLIGQELIDIELQTPSLKETLNKTFYIHKLDDRQFEGARVQTYSLHCCSREAVVSSNLKISRSFKDKPISEHVADIFQKDLQSETLCYVEDTSNNFKFIAPYWSPFETINWLSNRALNANENAGFLFFETNQSYEFTSLEMLMGANPAHTYIYADQSGRTSSNNLNEDIKYSFVESMYTDVGFDYFRRLHQGAYASKVTTFDMTLKTFASTDYDYVRDFNKTMHLDDYPLTSSTLVRSRIAHQYFVTKNNYLFGDKFDQGHRNWLLSRNALYQQTFMHKINLRVIGRFDIKVGNVIKLKINDFRAFGEQESTEIEDDMYTGRYLVTAIRHIIAANKHTMYLEVIKDSFTVNLDE
jgi:hypothetical protein